LIKHFKDTVYKDLLNQKVKGLNLTKDASEFRKEYVRLVNNNIELDIKTILSQYSQSGKLGK
jgi:regulatory protein YycI of two-component signal transduction system YycFG